ncbi:MAG: hypothetical protein LUI14_06575 [Lachnospiraceae bacterium]|nr:hypothetical protein [Lachnospiraceae bacterium]
MTERKKSVRKKHNSGKNTIRAKQLPLSHTNDDSPANQIEDGVMKTMMEFFAEEMLPVFGITQKVKAFAPTEEIHLDLKKGYQDFNLLMEDGSIAHFEFQSTNGGVKDLRRFRAYEANLSYLLQRPVTTYVLFSGKIKHPMTELKEGLYTYRVQAIIMSERNADELLERLRDKVNRKELLTREDLVVLPLLPVYGGESSQLERIQNAFEIVSKAEQVSHEDIQKIEAAIYAMATKFLNHNELESIKGGVKMTYLGQLLVADGRKEGRLEGRLEGHKEGLLEGRLEGHKEGRLEGRLEEQKNTERERLRADKAEADARKLAAELKELKKQYGLN